MQVFEERGKPLRAEKRTNKLNPHMRPSLEIELGPHLWGVSAFTTMPPLLSKKESYLPYKQYNTH